MTLTGNVEKNVKDIKIKGLACPKCRELAFPGGTYVDGQVSLPVNISWGILRITTIVNSLFKYCPSCGFLSIILDLKKG